MFCHYFALLHPGQLIYHVDYYRGLVDAKTAMNYFDLQKGVRLWAGESEKNFTGFSKGIVKFPLHKKTDPQLHHILEHTMINIVIVIIKCEPTG